MIVYFLLLFVTWFCEYFVQERKKEEERGIRRLKEDRKGKKNVAKVSVELREDRLDDAIGDERW